MTPFPNPDHHIASHLHHSLLTANLLLLSNPFDTQCYQHGTARNGVFLFPASAIVKHGRVKQK